MKTLVVNGKKFASRLLILSFVIVVSVMFSTVPALATEFEFGTQFGISHIIARNDEYSDTTSLTLTHIPGGPISGFSLPSLYATWFPNKNFAVGPEFRFGRGTYDGNDSITSLYFGGRIAYILDSHSKSAPYIFGRSSILAEYLYSDVELAVNIGGGIGYQWRIGPAFVLRTEAQYQRVLLQTEHDTGTANVSEFSFIIGIGTRFGNSEK